MIWAFGRYCSLFVPFRSVKYDPDHVMKKTTSFHVIPHRLRLRRGIFLLKRPMISPINEIVSIDERPVTNEHAGKIQSRLEHLSKSERKVAEVILATPSRPFIRASPPSPLRPGLANRPSIASAVVSKPADSLTSNCIWPRALRTARSMLTGMSMKTTALSHTREKYSNRPWRV